MTDKYFSSGAHDHDALKDTDTGFTKQALARD